MSKAKDTQADRPIGVFDSGLGGLTVVREMRRVMPDEDIIYLGDSARVPYGIKSLETVRGFALSDAAFLLGFGLKMLVVACNTAASAAVEAIRSHSPVDVVDVISAAAAEAVARTSESIGVIATEATISSGAYERAVGELAPDRSVRGVACPLLVPIVEEGRSQDDPIVLHVLCDYLRPLQRRRPGVLILGCTHYPLLAGAIAKLMGPDVPLVDSSRATALEVARRLCETGLVRNGPGGSLRCFTTGDPSRFAELGRRFGGGRIESVRHVGTDQLQAPPAGRPDWA